MKMKKYFGIVVILVMLLTLAITSTVSAGTTKVAVCHLDELGVYHLISISESAFPAHVAHMDASPNEWVPGQPGKKFADDCSFISIDKYTKVESLTVPSTGSPVSSSTLLSGQAYQLRASGFYKYSTAAGWEADARCSNRFNNPTGIYGWYDGALLGTPYGLQVSIDDGIPVTPLTPAGWVEACNTAHNYTATYNGTGAPLKLYIWDNYYGDNFGSITVDIYTINW